MVGVERPRLTSVQERLKHLRLANLETERSLNKMAC